MGVPFVAVSWVQSLILRNHTKRNGLRFSKYTTGSIMSKRLTLICNCFSDLSFRQCSHCVTGRPVQRHPERESQHL
jgi:hypothetical protein